MMIGANLDHKSEHIREVYAWFGLAMFKAQCLERQIALMLATKYGPSPTRISRREFDAILEDLFSKTLGQLVSEIGKVAELSEDEKERLQKGLSKRNWLAHNYFWDRGVAFLSESGRVSMIEELQEMTYSFETLDELFTNRTIYHAKSLGITQQLLDETLERLVRDQ